MEYRGITKEAFIQMLDTAVAVRDRCSNISNDIIKTLAGQLDDREELIKWWFAQRLYENPQEIRLTDGTLCYIKTPEQLWNTLALNRALLKADKAPTQFNGLTFAAFCDYLNVVDHLMQLNDNIYQAMTRYADAHNELAEYFMPNGADYIIRLLETIMNDSNEWIAYWVYECDFGRQYKVGCVTDCNGAPIPLATKMNLWNILTSQENTTDE